MLVILLSLHETHFICKSVSFCLFIIVVLFFHPFIATGKKERLAERGGVCSFGEACSDWFAAVTDSDQ